MLNNRQNERKFSTDPLDDAMRELLDICQQYNDNFDAKTSQQRASKPCNFQQNIVDGNLNDGGRKNSTPSVNDIPKQKNDNPQLSTTKCDIETKQMGQLKEDKINNSIKTNHDGSFEERSGASPSDISSKEPDSIERLQERQSELQNQLDEVLWIAKNLESRQKRKLKCILEDQEDSLNSTLENEDDELLEFQQIENELRISEINRQLSNIQEELRLRLYKRLLTNATNNSSKNTLNGQKQHAIAQPVAQSSARRNSTHTDESTPPSSSCSEEQPTSSSSSSASTSTPDSQLSIKRGNSPSGGEVGSNIPRSHVQTTNYNQNNNLSVMYQSNYRNNSANSDLERIDEDEEDSQDYYSDSNRFRTIYEEKLSPIIRATYVDEDRINSDPIDRTYDSIYNTNTLRSQNYVNKEETDGQSQRVNRHKVSSGTGFTNTAFNGLSSSEQYDNKANRPLTLYLPNPDDEIDLVEHIQALGHDLNIISSNIKLSQTSAHGYLYKACSKSSKKWLKRYFYFDRQSKTFSYYQDESQLVKKNYAPRNSVPFDDIDDVYVDHRLSGLSGSSKKSHVFVLSTSIRKFLLASSKAETMRVWIDILFTAANKMDREDF